MYAKAPIFDRTASHDARAATARNRLILLSPIVVVLVGQIAARTVGSSMGIWSWLPLTAGYWTSLFVLVMWLGGRASIATWLRPSHGSWLWPALALVAGILPPLPMLFPDTWRLFLKPEVWIPTLLFVAVNPWAEELYWRGLLLNTSTVGRKWPVVLYSSVLFMVNHLWIAVMAVGARNPAASVFQLVFGLLMCTIYLRTQSLRWPIAAHFLVNLLTPTVAVFLNLYVPGAG